MVSLKAANCPYCHSTSYFESSKTNGYCSECGKLIYFDKGDEIEYIDGCNGNPRKQISETFTIFLSYRKRGPDFSRTVMVNINGPENRQVAVNLNDTIKVVLIPGQYQIIGHCHVTAGVNSTDVIGSLAVDLHSDRKVGIYTSGIFSPKMEIY